MLVKNFQQKGLLSEAPNISLDKSTAAKNYWVKAQQGVHGPLHCPFLKCTGENPTTHCRQKVISYMLLINFKMPDKQISAYLIIVSNH